MDATPTTKQKHPRISAAKQPEASIPRDNGVNNAKSSTLESGIPGSSCRAGCR